MVQTLHNIEVPSKYDDRKTRVVATAGDDYATFYIKAVGFAATSRLEQFAHIPKEELLDVLAQIGWLPDEYRKPEPLDPREAKIRAVALVTFNDDAARETNPYLRQYDTYEELVEDVGEDGVVADYRSNAEALIDAGLVKVDAE